MGPSDTPSSPAFPALDPVIVDDEFESTFRNTNMDFLDPTKLEMPSGSSAGGDFDALFARVSTSRSNAAPESSKPYQDQPPLRQPPVVAADSPAESPDNSSRSSSSESPRNHLRHASIASTNSAAHSDNPLPSAGFPTEDWMRPELSSVKEESPFTIDPSFQLDGGFNMDPDLETSNKAMDAAFDFESAASSPSPLKTETPQPPNSNNPSQPQVWSPSSASAVPASNDTTTSSVSDMITVERWSDMDSNTCRRSLHPDLRFSHLVVLGTSLLSKEHFPTKPRKCQLPSGMGTRQHRSWKRVLEVLT